MKGSPGSPTSSLRDHHPWVAMAFGRTHANPQRHRFVSPDFTSADASPDVTRDEVEHIEGSREPCRVLHVTQPTIAGVANVVLGLVTDQVKRGYDVSVACPDDGDLAASVSRVGVHRYHWQATRGPGLDLANEVHTLTEIIADARPDVIHLHSSKAGLAGRLAVRGRVATIFQPHAWSFQAVDGPMKIASMAWERRSARWTSAIICVSHEERALGKQAGIRGWLELIPNGVDVVRLQPPTADERQEIRRRLGLPDTPLVVCVGRLTKQKGHDLLLQAFQRVQAVIPTANLVLVGSGPDLSSLRAKASGNVIFTGARRDAIDWLAASDVVAVPSRWEGCSLVVVEAMALGRAVVATDVGGARIIGNAGATVPIGDLGAFATALQLRLQNLALAEMEGRRGRDIAERHLDDRVIAARIAALYQDVVRRQQTIRLTKHGLAKSATEHQRFSE